MRSRTSEISLHHLRAASNRSNESIEGSRPAFDRSFFKIARLDHRRGRRQSCHSAKQAALHPPTQCDPSPALSFPPDDSPSSITIRTSLLFPSTHAQVVLNNIINHSFSSCRCLEVIARSVRPTFLAAFGTSHGFDHRTFNLLNKTDSTLTTSASFTVRLSEKLSIHKDLLREALYDTRHEQPAIPFQEAQQLLIPRP